MRARSTLDWSQLKYFLLLRRMNNNEQWSSLIQALQGRHLEAFESTGY